MSIQTLTPNEITAGDVQDRLDPSAAVEWSVEVSPHSVIGEIHCLLTSASGERVGMVLLEDISQYVDHAEWHVTVQHEEGAYENPTGSHPRVVEEPLQFSDYGQAVEALVAAVNKLSSFDDDQEYSLTGSELTKAV